jgi:hypothetical protein
VTSGGMTGQKGIRTPGGKVAGRFLFCRGASRTSSSRQRRRSAPYD